MKEKQAAQKTDHGSVKQEHLPQDLKEGYEAARPAEKQGDGDPAPLTAADTPEQESDVREQGSSK